MKNIVSNALQSKFILLNKEKLMHFKDLIEKECRQMARIMKQHDFEPLFDRMMNDFYKDLEAANLDAYYQVHNKYLDRLLDLRKFGKTIDAATQ